MTITPLLIGQASAEFRRKRSNLGTVTSKAKNQMCVLWFGVGGVDTRVLRAETPVDACMR
jgi:hypothetical protein